MIKLILLPTNSILLLYIFSFSYLFAQNDCNVFEAKRDESNYKLGYEFLTFPFRIVGNGETDCKLPLN